MFSKDSFRNNSKVSNGFDPDKDQPSVSPDLGPNCLQSLAEDDFVFVFVALRPKSTAMVNAGRSVHLTTLFPAQA